MIFLISLWVNSLLDKNSYKNLLICNISFKTFISEKPLRIWFDKTDGLIKIDNGTKCLVLLKYNGIYNRIKYLISEKVVLQVCES